MPRRVWSRASTRTDAFLRTFGLYLTLLGRRGVEARHRIQRVFVTARADQRMEEARRVLQELARRPKLDLMPEY